MYAKIPHLPSPLDLRLSRGMLCHDLWSLAQPLKWAATSLNLLPQPLQNLSKVTQCLGICTSSLPIPHSLLLPALSLGVLFFHLLQCVTSQLHSPHGSCLPLLLLPPLTLQHGRLWLFLCPIRLSTLYRGGIHLFALGKGTACHIGPLLPPIVAMVQQAGAGVVWGMQRVLSSFPTTGSILPPYSFPGTQKVLQFLWFLILQVLILGFLS